MRQPNALTNSSSGVQFPRVEELTCGAANGGAEHASDAQSLPKHEGGAEWEACGRTSDLKGSSHHWYIYRRAYACVSLVVAPGKVYRTLLEQCFFDTNVLTQVG